VDGVIAALLNTDFGFKIEEVREIFAILNKGDLFYYKDYLIGINAHLRAILLSRSVTP
jgi:hypothetical protein